MAVSMFERPEPMVDAWRQVRAWLACGTAWIPQPTERHADLLDELLALPGVHANLVPDAHLAALALEHGLTLYSTDGDFARFPALRWMNPLSFRLSGHPRSTSRRTGRIRRTLRRIPKTIRSIQTDVRHAAVARRN